MTQLNQSLVGEWNFRRLSEDDNWQPVQLPHSPFDADLDGQDHWHGLCEYRRELKVDDPLDGYGYKLYFGAAMHTARVLVDGEVAGTHSGGYLPFEVDVTPWVADGNSHELLVVLDNGDDENVPPGKPFKEIDFCWYGGLYRGVELRAYPSLHITDPVAANAIASGGLFVRTESLDSDKAVLLVSAHISNTSNETCEFELSYEVTGPDSIEVEKGTVSELSLGASAEKTCEFRIEIPNPKLWSPANPQLHAIVVAVSRMGEEVAHPCRVRFGIRSLKISRSGGLQINGTRIRPNGVNRHQDYPRVGYALSDAAQYRDAKRIKESGFDYVRLSHYPQSPAFLDACDELGILVMNCIPGWQFLGGEDFREACYRNARELIRRDRNHPCVILWELSLNETEMDQEFMDTMQAIGHEEYPGDQMYVCGWLDSFDVYIHSRQHGKIHSWENGDKPLVIAEYGDWEFYAANEGFDQKTGTGLLADWSNSRAFRGAGERRLRQQARNHIIALSDTLSSPAVCDGLWSMFDYPRGYHPTRAACGVMDIHRLPKYSYFFYKSQRSPNEGSDKWDGGPMVYIASRWNANSNLDVLVFSNCERIELVLNGVSLGNTAPSRTSINQHLPFPPFVFQIEQFNSGTLEAFAYIGDKVAAEHVVSTPGEPVVLDLQIDDAGVEGDIGQIDVLIAHARVFDANGQLCKNSSLEVDFSICGAADIVGSEKVVAESGVASVVIRRPVGSASFVLSASGIGFSETSCKYVTNIEDSEERMESIA